MRPYKLAAANRPLLTFTYRPPQGSWQALYRHPHRAVASNFGPVASE